MFDFTRYIEETIQICIDTGSARMVVRDDDGFVKYNLGAEWETVGEYDIVCLHIYNMEDVLVYSKYIDETKMPCV